MHALSTVKAGSTPAGVARTAGTGTRAIALLAAALVIVLGAAFAPAAVAAVPAGFSPVGPFADHGPDGTMIHHQRIAVDDATGNLLETDSVEDRINVYTPSDTGGDLLTSFGAGDLRDPFGIVVDQSTGDVYISDSGNDRIVRYVSDGAPTPTYTLDGTFTSPALGAAAGEIGNFAAALAIDQTAGRLLVADPGNNLVKRYRLDGTYDGFSFDGAGSDEGAFTGLLDLAVDSTGDVIVVDSTGDVADSLPDPPGPTSRVLRFDSAGTYESRIGPGLVTPATVAVRLAGNEVVVSANQNAVHTNVTPTVSVYDSSDTALFDVPLVNTPSGDVAYSTISGMAVGGGETGRLYVSTDVDRTTVFDPSDYGVVSIQAFSPILPAPPTVEPPSAFASDVRATTAVLNATITPNLAPTTYYFEYGLAAGVYTSRTAVTPLAGSAQEPEAVRAAITGIAPLATHHFRVVADNGIGGPVAGSDQTFTTFPLPATIVVEAATSVTRDSATLNATIDTNGAVPPGTYRFTVVEVDGLGSQALPLADVPAGNGPRAVTANVNGLQPGRTYRVGLHVDNVAGISYAEPATFATVPNAPFVPPTTRVPDDGRSPYGCNAPRLDGFAGTARRGQPITLTGADLGVAGTVTIGSREAETRSYASNRITVVVPDDVRGRQSLQLDCGKLTGAIPITISEPPSNAVSIDRPTVRGSVATLKVRVPGKGKLSLSGSRLAKASSSPARAGTVTLRARLTRAGRRALSRARSNRLRVTAVVSFQPDGGSTKTVRKAIVFRG